MQEVKKHTCNCEEVRFVSLATFSFTEPDLKQALILLSRICAIELFRDLLGMEGVGFRKQDLIVGMEKLSFCPLHSFDHPRSFVALSLRRIH